MAPSRRRSLRPGRIEDPEAYAVYASLLPGELPDHAARGRTLVVRQETGTNWECMPSGKPLEGDWRAVVDHFKAENAAVRGIRPGFALGSPYVVVSKAEIEARFHDIPDDPKFGWSGFYKRYPDSSGFFVLSGVGFDAAKKRALVYLEHSCGALCGAGTHHLLEKVEGAWREAKIAGIFTCMWVS